jgi:hypothetical protein
MKLEMSTQIIDGEEFKLISPLKKSTWGRDTDFRYVVRLSAQGQLILDFLRRQLTPA